MKKKFNYIQTVERGQITGNPRHSNFNGESTPSGSISSLNRTFTFVITNASNVTGNFVMFGWNKYGAEVAASDQSAFVTVTVSQSSHAQVLRDLAGSTYYIAGMKLRCTDTTQFSNPIIWNSSSVNGKTSSEQINPLDYFSAAQNQSTQIDVPADQVNFPISDMNYLNGTIAASATYTVILTLAARTSMGRILEGKSVVAMSNAGQSTSVGMQITGQNRAISDTVPLKNIAKGSM